MAKTSSARTIKRPLKSVARSIVLKEYGGRGGHGGDKESTVCLLKFCRDL